MAQYRLPIRCRYARFCTPRVNFFRRQWCIFAAFFGRDESWRYFYLKVCGIYRVVVCHPSNASNHFLVMKKD